MRISTAWQAQTICGRAQSIEQPSVRLEQGMPIEDARMVVRRRWRRARHTDGAHHLGDQPSSVHSRYVSYIRLTSHLRFYIQPSRELCTRHLLSAHLQCCHVDMHTRLVSRQSPSNTPGAHSLSCQCHRMRHACRTPQKTTTPPHTSNSCAPSAHTQTLTHTHTHAHAYPRANSPGCIDTVTCATGTPACLHDRQQHSNDERLIPAIARSVDCGGRRLTFRAA